MNHIRSGNLRWRKLGIRQRNTVAFLQDFLDNELNVLIENVGERRLALKIMVDYVQVGNTYVV
ncbi:MAG: hypothetical protein IJ326_05450 [Lachnospiraceae bacterium]|nr:hypothetical protein [Lachnospiraceae bacterium]